MSDQPALLTKPEKFGQEPLFTDGLAPRLLERLDELSPPPGFESELVDRDIHSGIQARQEDAILFRPLFDTGLDGVDHILEASGRVQVNSGHSRRQAGRRWLGED